MAKRYFTLDEANAQVPALERAFTGTLQLRALLSPLYARLNAAGHAPERDEPQAIPEDLPPEVQRDLGRFYGLVEALRGLVDDIEAAGCEIKDIETGLVDWWARSGSREVYLCWRLGEPQVLFFHDPSAGFAGRRPVAELESSPTVPAERRDEPTDLR